jgi:hypothetical protein
MRARIVIGFAAFALGTCASVSAFAAPKQTVTIHPMSYSNTGPWKAPLSPNGVAAAANAFGGPGWQAYDVGPYHATTAKYSNTGPWSAPLSPNGVAASADAFGGPGWQAYNVGAYHATALKYSNTSPKGAPLSPNGVAAAADAFGGPGYQNF